MSVSIADWYIEVQECKLTFSGLCAVKPDHFRWFVGASRDPPEKQAPMCTVHSFPHNIDHCLTFARSEFEGHLEKAPAEANAFLTQPASYVQVATTPSSILGHLIGSICSSWRSAPQLTFTAVLVCAKAKHDITEAIL